MTGGTERDPALLVQEASDWWSTSIIDIRPGVIRPRGIPIQDLIGQVSFPQMIWLMLRGSLPSDAQSRLLEAALVAAVDHGPHAPSIAMARMAVSCWLGLNGAMASAINALDGIHGGAGEQCLEIYARALELSSDHGMADAAALVLDEYTTRHGKIIPGFGHRFHPVDPRVQPLLELLKVATLEGVVSGRFAEVGGAIQTELQRRSGKPLPMNIDGVTAIVYGELGFSAPLARGLFILSRSVGILAHAWEQSQQKHRIKGPMPPSIPYRYTGA